MIIIIILIIVLVVYLYCGGYMETYISDPPETGQSNSNTEISNKIMEGDFLV